MKSVAMSVMVLVLGVSTGVSTLPVRQNFATGKLFGAATSAAAKAQTKPVVPVRKVSGTTVSTGAKAKPATPTSAVRKPTHGLTVSTIAKSKTMTGAARGVAVSTAAKAKVPATVPVTVQK